MMNKEKIYSLLYTNEKGEDIGLYEVQYLESPIVERIPELILLLSNEDNYIAYQSALILASWGNNDGIKKIEEYINNKIHESENFEPHRITGKDNVYDIFARAINLYSNSGGSKDTVFRLLKKLLGLYDTQLFQGNLQYVLEKKAPQELLNDMIIAFDKTNENKNKFQASQLLPVIAKIDHETGWKLIQKLLPYKDDKPTPLEFIAHALKYIQSEESKRLLNEYSTSDNVLVSEAAKKSLEFMNKG